ncbi:hypothetical protein V6615_11690 [Oscillospiraceae bacterium PP1C4]
MSELNNTESQVTETTEVTEITPNEQVEISETVTTSRDLSVQGYQNKTARLLNTVYIVMLVAAIINVGFQLYLTASSYLQQAAPLSLALLYSFASVLLPVILMVGSAFLFKFLAEVIELMDKKCK